MSDNKLPMAILMDAEEIDQTLIIEHDEDQNMVNFICEDGTYQSVWTDHLIKALRELGVLPKNVKSRVK